jgi:hypothetical protein
MWAERLERLAFAVTVVTAALVGYFVFAWRPR